MIRPRKRRPLSRVPRICPDAVFADGVSAAADCSPDALNVSPGAPRRFIGIRANVGPLTLSVIRHSEPLRW